MSQNPEAPARPDIGGTIGKYQIVSRIPRRSGQQFFL